MTPTTTSGLCDECSEHSLNLTHVDFGPVAGPYVCKACLPKFEDGPSEAQYEDAMDPSNKPLSPLENWLQNDEHHVR